MIKNPIINKLVFITSVANLIQNYIRFNIFKNAIDVWAVFIDVWAVFKAVWSVVIWKNGGIKVKNRLLPGEIKAG